MTRSLVLLLALSLPVFAAPAPFPKPAPPTPTTLSRDMLVGDWVMYWGTVRSTVTFSTSGSYLCRWCGVAYVGSWGVDEHGQLWITEACQRSGQNPMWQSYLVHIKPATMTGPIVKGADGVVLRFEKPHKPVKIALSGGR